MKKQFKNDRGLVLGNNATERIVEEGTTRKNYQCRILYQAQYSSKMKIK